MPTLNTHPSDARDGAVYEEQVSLVYRPLLLSVAATVAAASLFVAAQWRVVDGAVIAGWATALSIVTLLRAVLALLYRSRDRHGGDARTWGRRFLVGTGMAGLVWGIGGVMLFPEDNLQHQIICVLVIVGMCSGATTTLSVLQRATHLFLVPAMLPVTVLFFVQGHGISIIISLMLLLSFGFFVSAAKNIHQSTEETIRLRLAAEENERSLRLAKKEAEKASQAKSDFLANVSHEVRTPLNVILGMTHMALQTGLDTTQRGYLQKVQRAGEMLLGIIDDIIDFSRAEQGDLELVPAAFRLDRLLGELDREFARQARAKGLGFRIDPGDGVPAELIGDAAGLQRVLHNLLDNAVKFTGAGEVALLITAGEQRADTCELQFRVCDTGSGIGEADIDQLCQPFHQGDASSTRRHGGTGMGLALACRLVRAMGGSIRIDSEPGRGSEFSFSVAFTIPAAAEPGAASGARQSAPSRPAPQAPVALDRERLGTLLRAFRAQAADYDVAAEDTLAELAPLLHDTACADQFAALQQALGGYDFDTAQVVAGRLAQLLQIDVDDADHERMAAK